MREISKIKQRILQYLDYKDVSKYEFYQKTGASNGILSQKNGMSEENILKFLSYYNDVNTDWLLLGKEPMIKPENSYPLEVHKGDVPKGAIPFWNLPVSAGQGLSDLTGGKKPDGYVFNVFGMTNTEDILPVIGFSMLPEVKENALIGVRKMDKWETLDTSKKYLIITRDDRMIKYIEHDEQNEDILWCISPNYKRFKVYKSEVLEIQRVTFVVNPE